MAAWLLVAGIMPHARDRSKRAAKRACEIGHHVFRKAEW
jgi:hypothetical protein